MLMATTTAKERSMIPIPNNLDSGLYQGCDGLPGIGHPLKKSSSSGNSKALIRDSRASDVLDIFAFDAIHEGFQTTPLNLTIVRSQLRRRSLHKQLEAYISDERITSLESEEIKFIDDLAVNCLSKMSDLFEIDSSL